MSIQTSTERDLNRECRSIIWLLSIFQIRPVLYFDVGFKFGAGRSCRVKKDLALRQTQPATPADLHIEVLVEYNGEEASFELGRVEVEVVSDRADGSAAYVQGTSDPR